jgi:hypothetical protein
MKIVYSRYLKMYSLSYLSISVRDIPTIPVVKRNNKWFTADNRRLWVFRNLEKLGKCSEIDVTEGYYIPSSKFTTINGGVDVTVRNGSPGGKWYKKSEFVEIPVYASENNNGYTRFGENERKISGYSHHVQIEGEEYKYANDLNSGVDDTDKDCGNMCACVCFLLIIAIVVLLYKFMF